MNEDQRYVQIDRVQIGPIHITAFHNSKHVIESHSKPPHVYKSERANSALPPQNVCSALRKQYLTIYKYVGHSTKINVYNR